MKVAIIGAGVCGLASARYCLEYNIDIDIFEQCESFGGTWVYNENIVAKNGFPIHSSMYENLVTNLPKEAMILEGLEYDENITLSYIPQADVLNYLKKYVDKFKLLPYIKHCITNVSPMESEQWLVVVKDLKSKSIINTIYDAVIVCNGHFFEKRMPSIPGMDIFKGVQLHSCEYRTAKKFAAKTGVIIGIGASGSDIAKHISKMSKKIFLVGKSESFFRAPDAENIQLKPEIKELRENVCVFVDNTEEEIDFIIYCTGYLYSYPFLSDDSGIKVDDNWVKYVYRHTINIKHPTMALLGLLSYSSLFAVYNFQAKYYAAYLAGKFKLPDKEEMMKEAIEEQNYRTQELLWPHRHAHKLFDRGEKMTKEMAHEAGIEEVRRVYFNIHTYTGKRRCYNDLFKIIDDDNFVVVQDNNCSCNIKHIEQLNEN